MPQAHLKIRRAQLHALREPVFEEYLRRLAAHVAGVFPEHEALLATAKGLRFVRHCVQRAQRLGITDQHGIALFTDLCTALGPRWDQDARLDWIGELLAVRELSSAARLLMVYERVRARLPGPPLAPPELEREIDALGLAEPARGRTGLARPEVPQWPAGHWGPRSQRP
ncbi:hypothetical protein [Rubrivivax rivuli]|uniref:Uncharacterized protein n=1 Tax=Rubrivivax rivuli TaxID=1862385 RepID=A0A437RIA7_9BURK|nr:hypothetical protein [Rubrivivax rivuli]RVU46503.1 hypothetical protein EOE66_11835 [Rubrivivax rivuli]